MKTRFLHLWFCLLGALIFNSCSFQNNSNALLTISLPKKSNARVALYEPSNIVKYEVVITNENGANFSKTGSPGSAITFDNILTGVYTVDVFALDKDGYNAASGTTEEPAIVVEGKTSVVNIEASMLVKSDFFVSGPDGAWINDYQNYFANSKYKSYRNDVDFFATMEQDGQGQDQETISCTLKNLNIPYIFVDQKIQSYNNASYNIPYPISADVTRNKVTVSFEAKASKPTTINFFFQDTNHEPIGVVSQFELGTDFPVTQYTIDVTSTRGNFRDWKGSFRACVPQGVTVDIKNVIIKEPDPNTETTDAGVFGALTVYPPDTQGVKIKKTNEPYFADLDFTLPNAYAGYAGINLDGKTNYTIGGQFTNSENPIDIDFYLYTLSKGLIPLKSVTPTDNGFSEEFKGTDLEKYKVNDDYEFAALLLKPKEPCTVTAYTLTTNENDN